MRPAGAVEQEGGLSMPSDDGLFEASKVDQHPDAALAREEITRYYEDRVAEARAALAKAQALLDEREAAHTAWTQRGEIEPEGRAGSLRMEAVLIVSHASSRYMQAAQKTIANRGNAELGAAAEAASEREQELRRWLTAQGYDLGAMALPAPEEKPARGWR